MRPGSLDTDGIATGWQHVFRELSLAYHWTPQQIAELTVVQLGRYFTELPGTGVIRMPPEEALRYTVERMQAKHAWVAQMQNHSRGNTVGQTSSNQLLSTTGEPVPWQPII
jgi:hypothetical protein